MSGDLRPLGDYLHHRCGAILRSAWFSQSAATAPESETAVFFLLDSSASMLAESQSTSRLDEAKNAIAAMLADLPEFPVALVTFAGNAMLDFPPSLDHDNFRRALDASPAANKVADGAHPQPALAAKKASTPSRFSSFFPTVKSTRLTPLAKTPSGLIGRVRSCSSSRAFPALPSRCRLTMAGSLTLTPALLL